MVMLDPLMSGVHVVRDAGPDSSQLVRCDTDANPRSAENDAAVRIAPLRQSPNRRTRRCPSFVCTNNEGADQRAPLSVRVLERLCSAMNERFVAGDEVVWPSRQ